MGKTLSCAMILVTTLCVQQAAKAAVAVVPNAQETTLGNGQSTNPLRNYGTGGSRYQQVYASSQFGTFGTAEAITEIDFRAKQAAFGSFIGNSVTISNIIITLSTTQKTDSVGLDATLANNVGPDVQTVYSGPLTLTSAAGGTTAIDYKIALQNLFTYVKGNGNLLLDVLIPANATVSGNGSIGFEQFDTVTDSFPSADGISSAFGGPNDAVGSNSTTGLVTRFVTTSVGAVPEPASLSILTLGAGLLLRKRGRSR